MGILKEFGLDDFYDNVKLVDTHKDISIIRGVTTHKNIPIQFLRPTGLIGQRKGLVSEDWISHNNIFVGAAALTPIVAARGMGGTVGTLGPQKVKTNIVADPFPKTPVLTTTGKGVPSRLTTPSKVFTTPPPKTSVIMEGKGVPSRLTTPTPKYVGSNADRTASLLMNPIPSKNFLEAERVGLPKYPGMLAYTGGKGYSTISGTALGRKADQIAFTIPLTPPTPTPTRGTELTVKEQIMGGPAGVTPYIKRAVPGATEYYTTPRGALAGLTITKIAGMKEFPTLPAGTPYNPREYPYFSSGTTVYPQGVTVVPSKFQP